MFNKSFNQGKIFNKNKKNIASKKLLESFEQRSDIEPFEPSNPQQQSILEKENRVINNLNQQFNKKLQLYSSKYEEYLNELVSNQDKATQKYKNQVVKTLNGELYFINNYGYKRKINDATKVKCDASNPPVLSNVDFSQLQKSGRDIQEGETCDSGGIHIKENSSGQYAWINAKGEKRDYVDWDNRHDSCKKYPTIKSVGADRYNSYYKNPSAMTSTDQCGLDINPGLESQLIQLNNDLKNIATKIKDETSKRRIDSKDVRNETKSIMGTNTSNYDQRDSLLKKMHDLNEEKNAFKKELRSLDTIKGDYINNIVNADSQGIKRALWGVSAIIVGMGIYKAFFKSLE
jgi:hypothetical protein